MVRVEAHDAVAPLEREWGELADRVSARPFFRAGWIDAWWRAFGKGRLQILAAREGDRLVGVLPLAVHAGTVAAPTNWHTPEFAILGEDAAARAALAEAALQGTKRSLSLGFIPPEGGGLEEARTAAERAGYRILERPLTASPFVPVSGSFEDYLAASVAPKVVKEVRRRRRKLEQLGTVELAVEDGSERLDDLLTEGFAVEGSGWKDEQGTAIRSRPETQRFYTDVARWAAAAGTLRLFFLRLDGRPVAFVFGLEAAGSLYDLKGGYDLEFRTFGPGQMVAYELISYAFAHGLESFEFLGTAEPFKLEWTQELRERRLLQAFAPVAGLPDFAAYAYGRPLAKRVLALRRRGD
ncbi:MAG: hypothetical protein QOE36_316 [Gaiellaceae bacterium]|nr:hypothetical protein [Gaiellaceae bacterium]